MLKHVDEYRDPELARKITDKILAIPLKGKLKIMEVCGTHTMSISRFGLRKALSSKVDLISGPGCPVCVTPTDYIDKALEYAKRHDNIITTFGDMFHVPGSRSTLEKEKSNGADIRIVYSPLDTLKIANRNPDKKVIFLSVGFETTTPTIAGMLMLARETDISNVFILCGNKLVPPALKAILQDEEIDINGFLMPAHVSTMIGYQPYRFIVKEYGIPCVIGGFEALDILAAIEMIFKQKQRGKSSLENEYSRFAREEGNRKAMKLMNEIFEPHDTAWRGFGTVPKSGLVLRKAYDRFDIEKVEPVSVRKTSDARGCICSRIVKGISKPTDCKLFARKCTPSSPIGACMVSSEGTCAAYYKYERSLDEKK